MQLSTHFSREEFELDGSMPEECVPAYTSLCITILEPVRNYFGAPAHVTSGYRTPAANAAAHGVKNSQHMATANWCAADFYIVGFHGNMRPVFDWIRDNPELEWDQCTLEHDPGPGTDVIHISWTKALMRREALEGEVNNLTAYRRWPVAPPPEERNV